MVRLSKVRLSKVKLSKVRLSKVRSVCYTAIASFGIATKGRTQISDDFNLSIIDRASVLQISPM